MSSWIMAIQSKICCTENWKKFEAFFMDTNMIENHLLCSPRPRSSPKVILLSESVSMLIPPLVTWTSFFQCLVLIAGLLRSSINGRQAWKRESNNVCIHLLNCEYYKISTCTIQCNTTSTFKLIIWSVHTSPAHKLIFY